MNSTQTCDELIIGGGVVGLSLAWELARHGRQVTVLERGECGREASWAGAGILPPARLETATHPVEKLRGLSFQLHAEWARDLRERTGVDTGFRRCGGLYLAGTAGEAAALAALAVSFEEEQLAMDRLSGEQLAALEPELSGSWRAAYQVPDECQLRNPWHCRALIEACSAEGVRLVEQAEVREFELSHRRIAAVHTAHARWSADQFCVTAGAWSRGLLEPFGFRFGVFPVRGQIVLFRPSRVLLRRIVNLGSRYLVPREDGRILAGSTEEEVGFTPGTTPEAIQDLTELAVRLVPALGEAEQEQVWSGFRPASFDGLPYLGRLPGWDNVFLATGHFRNGLSLSPGTAVVMRELMLGQSPRIDVTAFRVDRG